MTPAPLDVQLNLFEPPAHLAHEQVTYREIDARVCVVEVPFQCAHALKVLRCADDGNATICNFTLQQLQRLRTCPWAVDFVVECSFQRGANEVDKDADLRRDESPASVQ